MKNFSYVFRVKKEKKKTLQTFFVARGEYFPNFLLQGFNKLLVLYCIYIYIYCMLYNVIFFFFLR